MTTLGREIKKARAALGWRQQRLQEATGISQKYLSRIENDHVDPSWSFVLKIARALNMDLRALYEDNGGLGVPEVRQPLPIAAKTHEAAHPTPPPRGKASRRARPAAAGA
jgi:transcriptional regulator with XRE-family HTH domain